MKQKQSKPKNSILAIFTWFLALAAVWLLWSGIYKPLVMGLGAVSCALTVFLAQRIGFFNAPTPLHILRRLPLYWLQLFIDVIKSNIDITRIILHPKLPISPVEVELVSQPQSSLGQVVLGNAITLTPGTLTLDINSGLLRVHCLTHAGAEELLAGDINRRTAELTEK
ncbi:MAG: Na+/H+ antiporter subunit E [Cellvibrionaceae bacterium]|nr:Na+/H+ antiporter subunit E [Cellvibrionaceae bacterium]